MRRPSDSNGTSWPEVRRRTSKRAAGMQPAIGLWNLIIGLLMVCLWDEQSELGSLWPSDGGHSQTQPSQTSRLAVSATIVKPQLQKRELEKHIVDEILGEGYDKRIRPSGINNKTGQTDGAAVVRVNTLIRSISKIDDVTMEYSVQLTLRQEWIDERLAFNKNPNRDYKSYNINSITLTEQERLWKPDLFFRNEKEGHFHKIIMPNVLMRINGEGAVLYSIRISLVLACPMDLKYYPLDKQNCTIEMASYGYLEEELKFLWKEQGPVQINQPLTLPRFALEEFKTAYCTSRTATGAYSCLRVDLIFKREFSYYLIQIYIPCCMLVIVSWVSFWLDPNAIPARVSLGVTTLLTMATQISGINASLPPVSYIKAIDVWTGVCLTFVFGALLEFALVNYASRSDAHARVQQARQEELLRAREAEYQKRQFAAVAAAAAAANQANRSQSAMNNNNNNNNNMPPQQTQPQQQQQQQLAAHHQNYPNQTKMSLNDPNGTNLHQIQQKSNGPNNNKQTPFRTNNNQSIGGLPLATAIFGAGDPNGYNHLDKSKPGLMNSFQQFAASPNKLANLGKQAACEIHHSVLHNMPPGPANRLTMAVNSDRSSGAQANNHQQAKKNVNFCRAWLNKFPSRSKRIDVISRIFFPKMFALFNLVYWTTYLFREDDIVRT